jgi:hypothetical protein
MSIFGSILSAVGLGSSTAEAAPSTATTTDQQPATSASAPITEASSSAPASGQVDIADMLEQKAGASGQRLNYQSSIVDLLKVLDLPSDLHTRKELAEELHYDGDTEDTAEMNQWLHRAVLQKLSENGGVVPAEWHHV